MFSKITGETTVGPAISIILEQLLYQTSIDQVAVVISPQQLDLISIFLSSLKWSGVGNLISEKKPDLSCSNRRSFLDGQITIIIQQEVLGFGDAILCAENFVNGEPFMAVVGDHIFTANCVKDMLNTYTDMLSSDTIGLTGAVLCEEHEIPYTGLLRFKDVTQLHKPNLIQDMDEKPIDYRKYIIPRLEGKFLSNLGIDILPNTIFDYLREVKNLCITNKKELELRDAMKQLQINGKLFGCLIDGDRYDFGNPLAYLRSINNVYKDTQKQSSEVFDHISSATLIKWLFGLKVVDSLSSGETISIASAPGRIDLMGGISDYSGGEVLQWPIEKRTYCLIVPNNHSSKIELISVHVEDFASLNDSKIIDQQYITWKRLIPSEILFEDSMICSNRTLRDRLNEIKFESNVQNHEPKHWPNYIIGVLHGLFLAVEEIDVSSLPFKTTTGVTIVLVSDIPPNSGLASSAALETSVILAAKKAFGLDSFFSPDDTDLAMLCHSVETNIVGAQCGPMDQLTMVNAKKNQLLSIKCHDPPLQKSILLPEALEVWAINSCHKRDIKNDKYLNVRVASMMGKRIIEKQSSCPLNQLCEISPSLFAKLSLKLPQYLSGKDFFDEHGALFLNNQNIVDADAMYPILSCTQHPVEENFRVKLFRNFLSSVSSVSEHESNEECFKVLSELMTQSHLSYTKLGLQSPNTDLLFSLVIDDIKVDPNSLIGARISGGTVYSYYFSKTI